MAVGGWEMGGRALGSGRSWLRFQFSRREIVLEAEDFDGSPAGSSHTELDTCKRSPRHTLACALGPAPTDDK